MYKLHSWYIALVICCFLFTLALCYIMTPPWSVLDEQC